MGIVKVVTVFVRRISRVHLSTFVWPLHGPVYAVEKHGIEVGFFATAYFGYGIDNRPYNRY